MTIDKGDIQMHVVKLGCDVYPQIAIANERTRLNLFAENAMSAFPQLFDGMSSGPEQFQLQKTFRGKASGDTGPTNQFATFVLTNRGPVVIVPLFLPGIGDTGLESRSVAMLNDVRKQVASFVPGLKFMRVGLVREVIFHVGDTSPVRSMSTRHEIGGAELRGADNRLSYRDKLCNVNVQVANAEITYTQKLPVGAAFKKSGGHALKVTLDVNNWEIRPLEELDIEHIVERADSLWPDVLLKYLSTGEGSETDDGDDHDNNE